MDTFACPVCRGSIALWAIRSDLTCPTCHWWLKSNIDLAMNRCLIVAVVADPLFFAALWIALSNWFYALFVSLSDLVTFGTIVGWFALRRMVVLRPFKRLPQ